MYYLRHCCDYCNGRSDATGEPRVNPTLHCSHLTANQETVGNRKGRDAQKSTLRSKTSPANSFTVRGAQVIHSCVIKKCSKGSTYSVCLFENIAKWLNTTPYICVSCKRKKPFSLHTPMYKLNNFTDVFFYPQCYLDD